MAREIRLEELGARLAERVDAGEMTQEDADEALTAAAEGDWPRRGPGRHHGPRARGPADD